MLISTVRVAVIPLFVTPATSITCMMVISTIHTKVTSTST